MRPPRCAGPGSGPTADDLAAAARLGADIPFCLVGGRAQVTGIGEIVEPLPHLDVVVTLVIPPLAVSTPAAYRAWDDLGGPTGSGPQRPRSGGARRGATTRPVARPDRRATSATAPTLAGSGATWFAEGEHGNALAELVDEGATVVVARTVPMDVARAVRASDANETTCDAGDACGAASSCASSSACACDAS